MISPTLDNGDEQKEGEWLEESHHGESTGSPEQHLFLSFWSSFGESKHLSPFDRDFLFGQNQNQLHHTFKSPSFNDSSLT